MSDDESLPPILRESGIRLVSMDVTARGTPRLKFSNRGRGDVREVVVYVLPDKPVKLVYGYSIRDPRSKTLTSYHGSFGDPDQDAVGDIDAAEF